MWVSNYKSHKIIGYLKLETQVIVCLLCDKYVHREPISFVDNRYDHHYYTCTSPIFFIHYPVAVI